MLSHCNDVIGAQNACPLSKCCKLKVHIVDFEFAHSKRVLNKYSQCIRYTHTHTDTNANMHTCTHRYACHYAQH